MGAAGHLALKRTAEHPRHFVAMPNNAVIHIQNKAPGPPSDSGCHACDISCTNGGRKRGHQRFEKNDIALPRPDTPENNSETAEAPSERREPQRQMDSCAEQKNEHGKSPTAFTSRIISSIELPRYCLLSGSDAPQRRLNCRCMWEDTENTGMHKNDVRCTRGKRATR